MFGTASGAMISCRNGLLASNDAKIALDLDDR